jgi:hypothetical protein
MMHCSFAAAVKHKCMVPRYYAKIIPDVQRQSACKTYPRLIQDGPKLPKTSQDINHERGHGAIHAKCSCFHDCMAYAIEAPFANKKQTNKNGNNVTRRSQTTKQLTHAQEWLL